MYDTFEHRSADELATEPGLVRSLVLWRERDTASCAVTLAVDLSALDAAGAAVNATELLPGEDPALLTGPDRVDIHHTVTRTGPAVQTLVPEGADQ
ncbi:MAG TPA: hypothetical protein VK453_18555 [Micromonosporaceae bacterium]|nr:hypothetical protein [Micromonosporaceae bacterium]